MREASGTRRTPAGWRSARTARAPPRSRGRACPSPPGSRARLVGVDPPVREPLPDLRAGDLGGRGVLHEVVDRDRSRTVAARPRGTGSRPRRCSAGPSSVISPGCRRDVEELRRRSSRPSRWRSSWFGRSPSTASNASRATGTRSGCATQVPSNPCPASRSLSSRTLASAIAFTSASRREGMNAAIPPIAWAPAAVARPDEELAIRAHERNRHRHRGAIGKDELRTMAELLDHAEDVVPAPCVEPGGVVAQLVEDLVHLEGGENRLDQHRRLDRPVLDARVAPPPR